MLERRHLRTVLTAVAIAVTLASCSEFRYVEVKNLCSNGSHGNPERYAPTVCVSVENSLSTPLIEPVHVFPHTEHGGRTRIQWMTRTEGIDLKLEMAPGDQTCVERVECSHNGNNCVAIINPNADAKAECKYLVWVEGQPKPHDPIIIIDACCTN